MASSGIGRALAVRLAAERAQLVVAAPRGTAPYALRRNRGHFDQHTDIVINNAGASLIGGQVGIGDASTARAVYEVNFWSPLALSAALVPAMVARGKGAVVNVTSTIQAVPLPLLGYYGSSKAALTQATRSLRLESAETPIRVVEVVPAAADTTFRDIDELPWKTAPPRTLPPVSPQSSAAAIVRALKRSSHRVVYPAYSLVPLEIPVFGRMVARIGGRRVDTTGALRHPE